MKYSSNIMLNHITSRVTLFIRDNDMLIRSVVDTKMVGVDKANVVSRKIVELWTENNINSR